MVNCEVIKAKTVFADEIFLFFDTRTVTPGICDLTGATISNAVAKICVLDCNVLCSNGLLTGTITFAICEDFTIDDTPVEFFFRVTKPLTFQKADCTSIDLSGCTVSHLQCQIARVSANNTITITSADTFEQTLDVEVKIIIEAEKLLCVELCKNTGVVTIVTPGLI